MQQLELPCMLRAFPVREPGRRPVLLKAFGFERCLTDAETALMLGVLRIANMVLNGEMRWTRMTTRHARAHGAKSARAGAGTNAAGSASSAPGATSTRALSGDERATLSTLATCANGCCCQLAIGTGAVWVSASLMRGRTRVGLDELAFLREHQSSYARCDADGSLESSSVAGRAVKLGFMHPMCGRFDDRRG